MTTATVIGQWPLFYHCVPVLGGSAVIVTTTTPVTTIAVRMAMFKRRLTPIVLVTDGKIARISVIEALFGKLDGLHCTAGTDGGTVL